MTQVTEQTQPFAAAFEAARGTLPGQGVEWLATLRKDAIERFSHLGFPTTRHEDWRFTNVRAIAQTTFTDACAPATAPTEDTLAKLEFWSDHPVRLVLVNGEISAELSSLDGLADGLTVQSLATALAERPDELEGHLARHAKFNDNAFVALNTALFRDGAYIHVARGKTIETPILLLHLTTEDQANTATHPRHLFVAEEGSQVTITEAYIGSGENSYLTNQVAEVVLGQNAVVDHYRVQEESESAFHVATLQVYQERSSNFANQNVVFGGAIVRNNINAVLDGEGIESTINGLTLGRGEQLLDNHTFIDHAKPHCNSYEVYKTILDDKAKGVFNGQIMVAEDAQKTDAKQTNQNLLLSKEATINTKPQLEIFADDVRCTHGATIGQLDDEAIFYLRSRGIHEDAARSILTYAFSGYILERIKVDGLRTHVETLLCDRLPMGNLVRGAL